MTDNKITPLPLRELESSHTALLAQLASVRDKELARAREMTSIAELNYSASCVAAKTQHATEIEQRIADFAQHAAAFLAAPVSNWLTSPTRETTAALRDALGELGSHKRSLLSQDLGREMLWAFVKVVADRDPKGWPRFVHMPSYSHGELLGGMTGSTIFSCYAKACAALLRGHTQLQLDALHQLEESIARVAIEAGVQAADGFVTERWAALTSGKAPDAITEILKQLDKKAWEQRYGTPADAIARIGRYEQIVEKRPAGASLKEAVNAFLRGEAIKPDPKIEKRAADAAYDRELQRLTSRGLASLGP